MPRLFVALAAALSIAGCVATKPAATAPRIAQPTGVVSILETIKPCWNGSTGGPRAVVKLHVARLNPDGTVPAEAVTIVDDAGNPELAASARRAVLNPTCQPWPKLPSGYPKEGVILLFVATSRS